LGERTAGGVAGSTCGDQVCRAGAGRGRQHWQESGRGGIQQGPPGVLPGWHLGPSAKMGRAHPSWQPTYLTTVDGQTGALQLPEDAWPISAPPCPSQPRARQQAVVGSPAALPHAESHAWRQGLWASPRPGHPMIEDVCPRASGTWPGAATKGHRASPGTAALAHRVVVVARGRALGQASPWPEGRHPALPIGRVAPVEGGRGPTLRCIQAAGLSWEVTCGKWHSAPPAPARNTMGLPAGDCPDSRAPAGPSARSCLPRRQARPDWAFNPPAPSGGATWARVAGPGTSQQAAGGPDRGPVPHTSAVGACRGWCMTPQPHASLPATGVSLPSPCWMGQGFLTCKMVRVPDYLPWSAAVSVTHALGPAGWAGIRGIALPASQCPPGRGGWGPLSPLWPTLTLPFAGHALAGGAVRSRGAPWEGRPSPGPPARGRAAVGPGRGAVT
jgi:hypothetical protein